VYLGNGRFAKVGLHNGNTRLVIWQWNVDELIETTRPKYCRVNDIWPNKFTKDVSVIQYFHYDIKMKSFTEHTSIYSVGSPSISRF